MSTEKPASNSGATPSSQPNSAGNAQTGKDDGKNNRRRSLRNKRRGRKPGETANNAPREQPAPPSRPVDKSTRENRDRRRRRRMRAKQRVQTETTLQPVEDILKDLPPLVPAFVYTHVLRPMVRDSFEFRTDHFSKVTRRMEDFHIDLSPLYPEGGDEIKSATYVSPFPPAEDEEETSWRDDEETFDDEEYDADAEVRTAAEDSLDAARLEGATTTQLGLDDEDELVDTPDLAFDAALDEGWNPDEGDDLDALA